MNKKGQQELIVQAGIFVILFFVGGFIGALSLDPFPGRFYVSGLVFAAFALGFGRLIIHSHH